MDFKAKFNLGDILHDTKRNLIGEVTHIGISILNNSLYVISYQIEANGQKVWVNETPQVDLLKKSRNKRKNIIQC